MFCLIFVTGWISVYTVAVKDASSDKPGFILDFYLTDWTSTGHSTQTAFSSALRSLDTAGLTHCSAAIKIMSVILPQVQEEIILHLMFW